MQRPPNRVYAAALAFFAELARAGLRHVCVCPGSRSSPLAVAAATTPGLEASVHLDERSAAFFALGHAKASRDPVALVCTSGTAAANFLPAVVEAHYARIPLVVLTADRPPELREWGAGQTIDQVHLYGRHVRWFVEAPVPEATPAALRHVRALAGRAVAEAVSGPRGPVHVNLPFREPLAPVPVPGDVPENLEAAAARGRGDHPYTAASPGSRGPSPEQVASLTEWVRSAKRGVIVAGPDDSHPDLPGAVRRLAQVAAWPVLAEATSQLRAGSEGPPVLAHGDALLRDRRFASAHAPDLVLRIGDAPTSKATRAWLREHTPERLLVLDPDGVHHDPDHVATDIWRVEAASLCDAVRRRLERHRPGSLQESWSDSFHAAEAVARSAVEDALGEADTLLEPGVVRVLARHLKSDTFVYVSNSMAVRDLDSHWPSASDGPRVLANRGANGIDGVTSSALGAAATGRRTVLLTGDLAFLHDLGGLAAAHRLAAPLTIVVVDNNGGGIFSYLPVAEYGPAVQFERLFRTPHDLDLESAARGLGVRTARVESSQHLDAALKESLVDPGVNVILVPIDRDRSVAHHRELQEAVSRHLADLSFSGVRA